MFPPPLALGFTAVFAATGLAALTRYAALTSGAATGGDRLAELSHLVMSIAMIGMAWGRTGDPTTADGVLHIVVFGVVGGWYLVRARRPDGRRRTGLQHLVMPVAMVWMVAAMPGLTGVPAGSGPAAGSHGHGGHGAAGAVAAVASPAPSIPAPPWMQVVTVGLAVLLGAAALGWAASALRPAPTSRLAATGHVLMSLGMSGMLLAML